MRRDRQMVEAEEYRKNLEQLVTARTEQLRQALARQCELLESLKRMQAIVSSEELRQAVQAAIEKLESPVEPGSPSAEFGPPIFGGKSGDPVPEAEPDDVKAVWQIGQDEERKNPQHRATGFAVYEQVCKPGANTEAVWYRSSMIWLLRQMAQEQLAPWTKEGQFDDAIFRVAATISMEWMEIGVSRQGLPFDVDEFFWRLSEGQAGSTI